MSIGGIVFLGTPHRLKGGDNRHFGERVVSILKLEDVAGFISRQGLSRLKETSSLLDGLASRFNRTNLRVDMLSVYEQRPTKPRDVGPLTLRSKVKKLIVRKPPIHCRCIVRQSMLSPCQIIDKSLCTIGTSSEQCLGVDLDHLQLPLLSDPDGSPIEQVNTWLASVITSSPDNIESQFFRGKVIEPQDMSKCVGWVFD